MAQGRAVTFRPLALALGMAGLYSPHTLRDREISYVPHLDRMACWI